MTDCPNKVNVSEQEPVFNWSEREREREVKILLLVVVEIRVLINQSAAPRTNNWAWLPAWHGWWDKKLEGGGGDQLVYLVIIPVNIWVSPS